MINNEKKKKKRFSKIENINNNNNRLNVYVDISFYRVYASISRKQAQNKWRKENRTTKRRKRQKYTEKIEAYKMERTKKWVDCDHR